MEKRGKLKPPITRDPVKGRGEFIDGNGKVWDVKAFNSNFPAEKGGFSLKNDLDKVKKELAKGENVIIDTQNLSPSDLQQLKNAITSEGLNDRVLFY